MKDFSRRAVRIAAVVACLIASAASLRADVILSASAVNDTLKKMQKLVDAIAALATPRPTQADAWFEIGIAADALTSLINDEVAAHGSQEKPLIDLAVSRTGELGVAIRYDAGKKKFFYDNAAFRHYLARMPRGARAADAMFKLIEGDFFQSLATDAAGLLPGAQRKRDFLRQYPKYANAVEVHLMLSVDYRDLFRHYQTASDVVNRDRYRDLTRQQLRTLMKTFPGAEQAEIARRMRQRFDDEWRARP